MWTSTPKPFTHALGRLARGWASKSLAVGAVATLVDVCVLLVCVKWLGFPNPLGAAVGVAVGSTVAFFGNRTFAFPDCEPEMGPQLVRFIATITIGMALHASLVHVLADLFTVPVVLAKLIADLAVFGLGQLFLLRYLVFPVAKHPRWLHGRASALPRKKKVRGSAARAA
ncbi:MAG: GtrA family protein [Myxococcaceae bacterium]